MTTRSDSGSRAHYLELGNAAVGELRDAAATEVVIAVRRWAFSRFSLPNFCALTSRQMGRFGDSAARVAPVWSKGHGSFIGLGLQ
jgi:hypothetical protein